MSDTLTQNTKYSVPKIIALAVWIVQNCSIVLSNNMRTDWGHRIASVIINNINQISKHSINTIQISTKYQCVFYW